MIKDLVLKNRSYRRFQEKIRIPKKELLELVDLARLAPSAKNLQHFKYHIAYTRELCQEIFPCTAWAGYLKDWDGPAEGERPVAYITVLLDTDISDNRWGDHGIPAQSILLGAVEKGYGGCIVAALKKEKLKQVLKLDNHLEIIHTIALGKPNEKIIIDEMENNDHRYWRDQEDVHHVPKRSLQEIVIL